MSQLSIEVFIEEHDLTRTLFGISKHLTEVGYQPVVGEVLFATGLTDEDRDAIRELTNVQFQDRVVLRVIERKFEFATTALILICKTIQEI